MAQTSGVINDLIELNNDRVAGFEKAMSDLKSENVDLKELFQKFASQSRKNGQELAALVGDANKVETGNSGSLPANVIDVVTKQSAEIQTAHDQVKALRDAAKA